MNFDPQAYGPAVAALLALDGNGDRLQPLALGVCSSVKAKAELGGTSAAALFPAARAPEAAFSGLWLYFSCLDESHSLSQEINTADGSFWHAIMHRQEPDPGNSSYWFRRVGQHSVFSGLAAAADRLCGEHPEGGFRMGSKWDPFAFIDFCEKARRKPGSAMETLALKIQRAEWQILFHSCASAIA
ncbi:MAG: hypothetical protein HYZ37_05485 [Candidatus Solibacter usitatus]|nr:hypothetical protein [Candidatus Solibacter usitatus]